MNINDEKRFIPLQRYEDNRRAKRFFIVLLAGFVVAFLLNCFL